MERKHTPISETQITTSLISKHIHTLRGCQVMFDADLSEIYDVETRVLKRAVRSNRERFPEDFMFEPTEDEIENLRSKFRISNVENLYEDRARPNLRSKFWISSLENDSKAHGGSRYTPFAFTELGVAMLSSVLNSPRAIQVNIGIMRIFVNLRKELRAHLQLDLIPKVDSLVNGLDLLKQRVDSIEHKIEEQSHTDLSVAAKDPVSIIQNAVARHWGLRVEDLKSTARKKSVSIPRQIAIYLVRKHLCMGLSEIGQHFGRRDHSTILHAYRRMHALSDVNSVIRNAIGSLQSELQAKGISN